jgi:hypothetical protein
MPPLAFSEVSMRSTAQWRAAWALLPEEWRRAIADFCLQSDRDVAVVAMRMPTLHVYRPS